MDYKERLKELIADAIELMQLTTDIWNSEMLMKCSHT